MKNVSSKLLKAIDSVGGKVKKTGWNNFSKYHYMTESDINEAVLPALIANGLIVSTSLESFQETPASNDNKNRFCSIILNHKVIDTESGESLEFRSAGVGADTLDKAIYKAYAGSCKYFFMKLFVISGDDSDPENDGPVKETPTTTSKPKDFPKPETKVEAPKETKPAPGKGLLAKQAEANTEAPKKPSFGNKKLVTEPVKEETEEDAAF